VLVLIIAWAGLMLACWLIGTAILNGVKGDCFERIGDRLIIAVWLGVVILSVSLLGVSLVLPLSPLVGAMVAITMMAIALSLQDTRAEIRTLLSVLSAKWIFGLITLEAIVAASASQKITFFDTGLYHFQVIRWLSRFGAVPGLALIHNRFGFTSSWFALAAPFNAGIFEARTAALTSGFAFLLASLQFLICLTRIWQERGLFEDWFIVIFSFLCLPTISLYGMPISPSPDLPGIVLTGIVAWAYMILNKKNKTEKKYVVDSKTIPLILSVGAVTIKLSTIPLLLVSSLFYILGRRLCILRIFICGAIILLLMLPMLGFGLITSGCPLYPSSFMCTDLPWSVGAKNAKIMSKIILDWARWNGFPPANANSWNWFAHWIKVERAAAFLLICSILSSLGINKSLNRIQVRSKNYIVALGLFGMSFMIYRAPSLRFGLGYFCLLPALLMTAYCYISSPFLVTAVTIILGTLIYCFLLGLSKTSLALAGVTVIVSLVAWFYSRKNNNKFFLRVPLVLIVVISLKFFLFHSNNLQYLILPAKLLTPNSAQLLNRQTNDIKYVISTVTSTEGLCWAAELPCTPTPIPENIKLRDPEGGIAKGFIRN
jgi:hypothetical protein